MGKKGMRQRAALHSGPRAAMWNSMRQLRTFTAPDLQATAEVSDSRASRFLLPLVAAGYVVRLQPARGVLAASYRLVRNTGPVAPRVSRDGTVYDANLADPATAPRNKRINRHAPALLKALRELVDVVERMDLDRQAQRPSEREYSAALLNARAVLAEVDGDPA